jgi:DNA-binding response OmpR family regulator
MFVLVEDNRNFGIIIRDYLFTNHGQIEWVETVAQAKLLIARHHKTISCAIVDWMLPDGDGPTLCRWIKDQYSIPVILSTARSQIDDKLE